MKQTLRRLTFLFLAGLVFSAGLATAQVITRSVQMSQDPSGPVGFDANNNMYIQGNRHFNAAPGTVLPTLGTCTGGALTAGSTDLSGQVVGATAATCAVVFGQAYATAPKCLVTPNNATAATTFVTAVTGAGFTFNQTATTTTFNWICVSVS